MWTGCWWVGCVLALGAAPGIQAQAKADVITGRVIGPDSAAVAGATIVVMDTTARTTTAGRTGVDGRYSVSVEGGSGRYLVRAQAPGLRPDQRFLTRGDSPSSLVADFRLGTQPQTMAAVRVQARRPRPQRENPFGDELGGGNFFGGRMPTAGDANDLASWAALSPGLSPILGSDGSMGGFSALGLGGDQNNMMFQGMQMSGVEIPRAGGAFPIMSTNSADPSRGGFTGGLAQMYVSSGSNFRNYNAVVNIEDPTLQATDRAAARLGQEFRNVLVSAAVQGPIVEDRIYYNTSFQVTRRTSDLASLLGLDGQALQAVGLSRDSLNRFEQLVTGAGIPLTLAGFGSQRVNDNATLIGRFDLSPTGTTAANLVTTLNAGRSRGLGIGPTSPLAAGGESTTRGASAVYTWSKYYRQAFLQEFKGAAGYTRRASEPWLDLPSGRVRVQSQLVDGTAGTTSLGFGGNAGLADESRSGNWELQSNTSWVSADNKHRLKLASSLQYAWSSQESAQNALGTWTYNSLDDLARGVPASFTRNLTPRVRDAAGFNWFTSIGDSWRVGDATAVQGGLRLEGNYFTRLPGYNPEVERQFGIRTDRAPNRWRLSPRLGFRHTFNLPKQSPTGPPAFFDERKIWTIRATVGEYRNMVPATLLSGAFDATGLPSGWRQLSCFGAAAPQPVWDDAASTPERCLDGATGGLLTDAVPRVLAYGGDWDASRSQRVNASVARVAGPLRATIDVTWARNVNQGSNYDHNFAGRPAFTLPDEAGRPVFVTAAGIDPRTGATSPRGSRLVDAFGQVNVQRADLRSESRQLILSLSPRRFSNNYFWNVTWTQTATRGQQRGFGGSGIGDPRLVEWGPLGFAPRHQVATQFSLGVQGWPFRLTLNHRLSSGTPFTPTVGGDVNGDGVSGDRAFIAGRGVGDPALATAIDAVAAGGPSYVRDCLRAQAGRFAGLNSCRGPWTQTMGLVMNVLPGRLGVPTRMNLSLTAWNPLGGVDQLVNGNDLRGWGQAGFADPTLLYVRGFDPARQRFQYEVNPRFGDARASRTAFRAPFRLALEARFRLGPPNDQQQLSRELSLGRTRKGDRLVSARFRQTYARIPFNPLPQLLQMRDSLGLTAAQVDSLNALQRRVQDRMEAAWAPTADWLGALGDTYDLKEALQRVRDTRQKVLPIFSEFMADMRRQLREDQVEKLPEFVRQFFNPAFVRLFQNQGMFEVFIAF
ncbi:MAG: carboxypeptidase regulatory-like domain-containing protein [Gemmatimonadetes bacterium]|nr:carboxypeptidase regulatory-like domain-containing protein [Gemmatimonadota bacterium]